MASPPNSTTLVREPIYQQINQLLRGLLGSREFRAGNRFLTERQICERYGVSRVTANKALSNLVSEGVLEFRKGVGTFVRQRAIDLNLRSLVSFTAEALAAGKQPATRVIHFESLPAGDVLDEVPALLGAAAGDPLFYLERLRLADGVPVILEKRYVVAALCPDLHQQDLEGSLYELWSDKYGLKLEDAEQSIRAVNLRGTDARSLDVREGAAGFLITSVGFCAVKRPLWFERTLYRGDSYEFRNRPSGRFL